MKIDFKDINYLKLGNSKQKLTYKIIMEYRILALLKEYDPIVVGTIPINIDIEGSDIDIILQTSDLRELSKLLSAHFSRHTNFGITLFENETLTCNFEIEQMQIELFAKNEITANQNGYRHMIKEYEILQSKSVDFARQIRDLKREGVKTEPAFCKLLNIKGDPYIELLTCQVK